VWVWLTPSQAAHFLAYGLLMLWFSLLYSTPSSRLAYGVGFVAMGVGLEFLQGALRHRMYETFDIIADTIGVLFGFGLALALQNLVSANAATR
jgi:hypothetical protein